MVVDMIGCLSVFRVGSLAYFCVELAFFDPSYLCVRYPSIISDLSISYKIPLISLSLLKREYWRLLISLLFIMTSKYKH